MKKFTVKDFIAYNNPCFSCGEQIKFQIGFMDLEARRDMSYLRPTVTQEYTQVDLRITYSNSLSLKIDHKTNRLTCANMTALEKYLAGHKLFLASTCDKCYTTIESQFIEFNLLQGYVGAVGLAREMLFINYDGKMGLVNSSFIEERSSLSITNMDKTHPLTPFNI